VQSSSGQLDHVLARLYTPPGNAFKPNPYHTNAQPDHFVSSTRPHPPVGRCCCPATPPPPPPSARPGPPRASWHTPGCLLRTKQARGGVENRHEVRSRRITAQHFMGNVDMPCPTAPSCRTKLGPSRVRSVIVTHQPACTPVLPLPALQPPPPHPARSCGCCAGRRRCWWDPRGTSPQSAAGRQLRYV